MSDRNRWCLALGGWALLLGLGAGCGQVAKEAAREAAPTGVASGLRELGGQDNRQVLDQLARSQAVQSLGYRLGDSVTHGVTQRLLITLGLLPEPAGDADAAEPTTQPASSAAATQAGSATRQLPATTSATTRSHQPSDGGPAIQRAAQLQLSNIDANATMSSIGQAMDRNVRPAASALARDVTAEVIRELVRAARDELGPALSSMIGQQVAPVIGKAIREQVAPAVTQAVAEQLAPALKEAARQGVAGAVEGATVSPGAVDAQVPLAEVMSRQVARGATLGVADAATQNGLTQGTLGNVDLQQTLDRVLYLTVALLAVAGLLALGLMIGMLLLAWSMWRSRPASAAGGGMAQRQSSDRNE
jgi:hypothetical protein